jgi:hypothetical protein
VQPISNNPYANMEVWYKRETYDASVIDISKVTQFLEDTELEVNDLNIELKSYDPTSEAYFKSSNYLVLTSDKASLTLIRIKRLHEMKLSIRRLATDLSKESKGFEKILGVKIGALNETIQKMKEKCEALLEKHIATLVEQIKNE